MPVVTLDGATIVGEVRDVLFDPSEIAFVGFTLRGRGLLGSPMIGLLPAHMVKAIGHDAVMIEGEGSIVRDPAAVKESIGDRRDVPGTDVVTDAGRALGAISDIVLDVGHERAVVVGFCVERDDGLELIVPAPEGPREWTDAIVVPEGVEQRAAEGLVGLREVLEQARRERGEVGL